MEGETGGSAANDVIGPKDIQWLKYYLRSPTFSKRFSNDDNDNNIDNIDNNNIQELVKGTDKDDEMSNNEVQMSNNYF